MAERLLSANGQLEETNGRLNAALEEIGELREEVDFHERKEAYAAELLEKSNAKMQTQEEVS